MVPRDGRAPLRPPPPGGPPVAGPALEVTLCERLADAAGLPADATLDRFLDRVADAGLTTWAPSGR